MSKIEKVQSDAKLAKYAYKRARLQCLECAGPDLGFEISQTAQVARGIHVNGITKHEKLLNKAIIYVYDYKVSIHIPKDKLRLFKNFCM